MIRIKRMKYGIYWSFARLAFHKDYRGIRWLKSNPVYFLYILLVLVLFFINITLIGQLMRNSIFNRPIFLLMLSPLAWSMVLAYFRYTDKKMKEA